MRQRAGSFLRSHQPAAEAFQKAIACHGQGRLSEAERYYQAVLAIDDRHFPSVHGLGVIRLQQGRHADAAPIFGRAINLNRKSAEAHHHLAVALTGIGRPQEAVGSFKRALAINPNFAEAHDGLGHSLQMLDRAEEAITEHEIALRLKPSYATAHNNLANALQKLGRSEAAIAHYEKALALWPTYPEAHNNLGMTLAKLGRLETAVTHYEKALASNPRYVHAHTNLGIVLAALERNDEAIVHYQKALALDPANGDVYDRLGRLLLRIGRADKALECYQQLIALQPDLADAHNGLGVALETIGRMDEAVHAFEKAIAVAPRKGTGYCNLVAAKRLTADDPHFASMQGLAREIGSLGVDDQITLRFALSKVFDQLGDCAQSFGHLIEGNRLAISAHREDLRRAAERERMLLARLRANELPAASDDARYPISLFILGPSRSGKTTMERLVGILEGVEGGSENPVVDVAIHRTFQRAGLPPSNYFELLPAEFHSLCCSFYLEELARRAGSARVVTNTHPARIGDAALVAGAFPNVRFICMKRNLEDNILRIFQHRYERGNFYSYDLKAAREHVSWYNDMIDLLAAKIPQVVRIIRYEDMVADPAAALRVAAELCELSVTAGVLPAVGDDRGCAEPYRALLAAAWE
jgi:tetratricopeptide (TPR) repeat protein